MRVAFTICSNNYLAQAKVLGDSLISKNPEYKFVIGLVDKFSSDIDYSFFNPYDIIPIHELGIESFDEMVQRYDIVELNTAVKPFLFNFLFEKHKEIECIFYFDPDIFIYERIDYLENALEKDNIVLTPHFITPIYDAYSLSEPDILNAGLYNLGFIGVKRSEETQKFLDWWMIKLKDQCFVNFAKGLFVDQLWINFVPLYFENVSIIKHLGFNVAYWNLHERKITKNETGYSINNLFPLIFYHFSGYNFNEPNKISKYQNRFTFEDKPDVLPLFEEYSKLVISNKFNEFSIIPCHYITHYKRKIKIYDTLSYRDHFYIVRQKLKRDLLGK